MRKAIFDGIMVGIATAVVMCIVTCALWWDLPGRVVFLGVVAVAGFSSGIAVAIIGTVRYRRELMRRRSYWLYRSVR